MFAIRKIACQCAFALALAGAARAAESGLGSSITLGEPLGAKGTISFILRIDRSYRNGAQAESAAIPLLEIPGIARMEIKQAKATCMLDWQWDKSIQTESLPVNIPELPGPEDYFILYTWDAADGRFEGYCNGSPLIIPGTKVAPWTMGSSAEIRFDAGRVDKASLAAEAAAVSYEEAQARIPAPLRGKHAELFGERGEREPLQVEARKGELLYESALDSSAATAGWVMEGPGIVEYADGWMRMRSELPDGPDGHIVHWCPRDFPDRFVAEWEAQRVSEYGLCIVFFAAKGENGEDIFDPSLPRRNGVFKQYTNEAIRSYHVSYYANIPGNPGRITSNLRKNNWFFLVTNGPPGIMPDSTEAHRIQLIKDSNRLQLLSDGCVIVDFLDNDPERYYEPHTDGKIGFRQMQWTEFQYRNFKVWALEP